MNHSRRAARRLMAGLFAVAGLLSAACESEPLFPESPVIASSAELFSAAREGNLSRPAAFDFIGLLSFRIEVPGTAGEWDLLVSEQNGQLVFVPSAAFPQFADGAKLTTVPGQTFAQLETAPRDANLYTTDARAVQVGTVYVIRLRGASCTRYAKFHVTEVDATTGRVAIEFTRNPNCGGRSLVVKDLG